jgi:hypothetical protein
MIIKFFSSFCSSIDSKKIFENLCESHKIPFYGKDKNINFTIGDDYTHAIIMNTAIPILTIPKENVIGLAFEPYEFLNITPSFIDYAKKHIGKYLIGDKRNLPDPFIEHFGYLWYDNPKQDITYKPKIMSICLSEKQSAPGHIYRHTIVKEIIKHNLPIDIYGRGSRLYYYNNHSKGVYKDIEPFNEYMFSICIENYSHNEYFSEKFISPLLCNCMPIYYGCTKINQYFDEGIILSGNVVNDIQILKDILNEPYKYYTKTYTEKNLKTVNLIQNLDRLFTPMLLSYTIGN